MADAVFFRFPELRKGIALLKAMAILLRNAYRPRLRFN
jgi:hypothetical protein